MCCLGWRRVSDCPKWVYFWSHFWKRTVSWSCSVGVFFLRVSGKLEICPNIDPWGTPVLVMLLSKCLYCSNNEDMKERTWIFHVLYFLWLMNYAGIISLLSLSCWYPWLRLAPHMALLHLAEAYDSFHLLCPYLSYLLSSFSPSY